MSTFDSYATKYQHLRMERRNGILQVTLHSNGTTLQMLDNLGYGLALQGLAANDYWPGAKS